MSYYFASGKGPFTPAQLPNLFLWLATADGSFSIGGGNLTATDKSGHGNNGSQVGTSTTIVGASSGVPAHLALPGVASSITGTWASAIPAATPVTIYVLRQVPVAGNGGNWFKYVTGSPVLALQHDRSGAPAGRTYATNLGPGQTLAYGDVVTAWVVDVFQQDGANNGFLYQNNTLEVSGAFNNQAAQTLGSTYIVAGANQFFGQDDARGLAEVVLDLAFDSAATRAKMVAFLLARIPP